MGNRAVFHQQKIKLESLCHKSFATFCSFPEIKVFSCFLGPRKHILPVSFEHQIQEKSFTFLCQHADCSVSISSMSSTLSRCGLPATIMVQAAA
jgi:hypothetical protein